MPGITPMISPGVRVNVVDQSQYTAIPGLPTNAFAIVGAAQWGPINTPVLLTSVNQFLQTFSEPIDVAGLTAINTLAAGGTVYYCRFANTGSGQGGPTVSSTMSFTAGASTESSPLDKGTLKISAKYAGTLLGGGRYAWIVTLNKGTNPDEFKMTISYKTSNTADPISFVDETELSFKSNADNYFGNWQNDYFSITSTGDPTSFKQDDPEVLTFGNTGVTQGSNGVSTTTASNATYVKTALNTFSDRETYEIMYLSTPEYSTASEVANVLVTIATDRKDCIAQIDHDPNLATYKDDSSSSGASKLAAALSAYATTPYVGLWAGLGGYILDPYNNNAERLVPVSAYLLPALAAEYAVNPVWTAPASTAYLNLNLLTRLDKIWSQADRDTLYAANINPITNYKGLGYTAMGQKSGQKTKSAMDRLNVVQLVNYVKVGIEKISVDFLFAPIDDETFSSWTYRVSNFLNNIKTRRGLYDFRVKMDWETVTSDAVNNNLMPGIVQIKPTKVAEFIDIDLIIKNYSDSME